MPKDACHWDIARARVCVCVCVRARTQARALHFSVV